MSTFMDVSIPRTWSLSSERVMRAASEDVYPEHPSVTGKFAQASSHLKPLTAFDPHIEDKVSEDTDRPRCKKMDLIFSRTCLSPSSVSGVCVLDGAAVTMRDMGMGRGAEAGSSSRSCSHTSDPGKRCRSGHQPLEGRRPSPV